MKVISLVHWPLLLTPKLDAKLALSPARLAPKAGFKFWLPPDDPLNGWFPSSATLIEPKRPPTLVRFGARLLEPVKCAEERTGHIKKYFLVNWVESLWITYQYQVELPEIGPELVQRQLLLLLLLATAEHWECLVVVVEGLSYVVNSLQAKVGISVRYSD